MPTLPPQLYINEQVLLFVALGAIILLTIWIIVLDRRLRRIFRGKKAHNLEEVIMGLAAETEKLTLSRKEIEEYLLDVERRLKKSTQGVSIVRFNPFKGVGMGGNQSFSVAMINEHGDGVVFSGIYARDQVRVYAKSVKNLSSEHELSKEEQEAIKRASVKLRSRQ